MTLTRRQWLRGAAGVTLGLPLLEGLAPRRALASESAEVPPFAIFFRQANGVQQAGRTSEIGNEPERFWPTDATTLTVEGMRGRATGELVAHRQRLLMVRCNLATYDYGDGHAAGALQGLTAAEPLVPRQGGNSEAGGESLDHRIGRELNPDGRDSLFLYAGRSSGWLGGACISYRGPGQRRAAQNNPWSAYQSFATGGDTLPPSTQAAIAARTKSVNDLVREQMQRLLAHPRLSGSDRRRLDLHFSAIRDLEVELSCRLEEDQERTLEGQSPGFNSTNGDDVLRTARLHMDVASLAVACGQTRSVAIQVGNGNDGDTRYRGADGNLMENFHYVSHRRRSHDAAGTIIANSDLLHHQVDVQFARTFLHLLDRLASFSTPAGTPLLDAGMAIWYNDMGNGPPHSPLSAPFIIAGSAGGQLRQGVHVNLDRGWGQWSHRRVLNTIGAAVGLRNAQGGPLDNFGSSSSPGGRAPEMLV